MQTNSDQANLLLQAAQRLLDRYGWKLLSAEDLARRAADLLGAAGPRQEPDHACLQAYAAELHRLITNHDTIGRDQALTELWTFLCAVARSRCEPVRAEEHAQSALVTIWQKRDQCQRAASFIAWAIMVLTNVIRQAHRRETRPAIGDEAGTRESREICVEQAVMIDDQDPPHNAPQTSMEQQVALREAQRRFLDLLQGVLPSSEQVRVIVGLFLEERDPAEMAAELGRTIQYVYVLKSRALKRLEGNPEVQAALADLVEAFPQKAEETDQDA